MNKKGSIMDIIIWIIIGFILILFLGVWMYGHNLITNTLLNAGIENELINITSATEDTFGQVNDAMTIFHFLAFGVIFAMAISIFISNYLIKANPVFFIIYIFIAVVAVIFSALISNAYEKLMVDSTIGSTLSGFGGASFIMLNLPLWTAVIGIVGAIFLFIGVTRDREVEGSII